uniref:CsbD family protein n=1 Tax=Ascaris lumbricoides TaxID=6252 RepID=A0A0M3IMN1_ASCLU
MSQAGQRALHRRIKGVKMQIQVSDVKGYVGGYMKSHTASEFDRVGSGSSQVEGRERGSVGILEGIAAAGQGA